MNIENKYYPLPQPNEIKKTEKEDAMGAYFMMFASIAIGLPLPIINLIASTIYLFMGNVQKSRFVKFHAYQSLLSQIPITIINVIGVVWFIILVSNNFIFTKEFYTYLIILGISNLIYFIISLYASTKAKQGRFFYFLFFGKIVYHIVFLKKNNENKKITNLPPK